MLIVNHKNLLFSGILFFLIYAFSCCQKTSHKPEIERKYSPQLVGEQPTDYLVLRFHFRQDSIELQQVRIYPGKLPLTSKKIEGEDYQLVLLDSSGQNLFIRYFSTPGKIFYDQIDSSGTNISGGQITRPESLLELKIPHFTHLHTLKIISPQQKTVWQAELKNILNSLTK